MSYTPNANVANAVKAARDEASHQLAYGQQASTFTAASLSAELSNVEKIACEEVSRAVVFHGQAKDLFGGKLLSHASKHIFMRYASNRLNHAKNTPYDESDSLSEPSMYLTENGTARMSESGEEIDIVHSIAIKNIRNNTGMDLVAYLVRLKAAGSTSFVNGAESVSDIIYDKTDDSIGKTLYTLEMTDELSHFISHYFDSTPKSVMDDVVCKDSLALVRIGSPILHFYDIHKVKGQPVNTHSSKLPKETMFGRPYVQMDESKAKTYLEHTKVILQKYLAHADVCSQHFAVRIEPLQDTANVDGERHADFSFDLDIEYVKAQ